MHTKICNICMETQKYTVLRIRKPRTRHLNWSRSYPMKAWWRRLIGLRGKSWLVFRKDRESQRDNVNRSHVIRLNTTPEQDIYFRRACGVARHAYNWALVRWKEARTEGKRIKMQDLKAQYNKIKGEQFPWVYETTKCAPEQAFADLGQAFANYRSEEHTSELQSHVNL